jgi:hypothetical protein
MTLRALHLLRWDAPGQWTELADLKPLPDRVERAQRKGGSGDRYIGEPKGVRP